MFLLLYSTKQCYGKKYREWIVSEYKAAPWPWNNFKIKSFKNIVQLNACYNPVK